MKRLRKARVHWLLVKLFVAAFIFHYSLIIVMLSAGEVSAQSQGIGINMSGTPTNPKALLDIDATGMNPKVGVLIPRMNTTDRNAITSPIPESMLIYNTDTHCFEAYYNGVWVAFGCLSSCGSSFIDSRDGQSYKTVQIGTQCWMAQNLNYGTYEALPACTGCQPSGFKYCQNLSGVNDASCPLGGLYEWDNLMNGSASCNGICTNVTYCNATGDHQTCTSPVQGLCPSGWHVPSQYEWAQMENFINSSTSFPYIVTTYAVWLGTNEGAALKSPDSWLPSNCCNVSCSGGTCNSTGFNALPGGMSWIGSFYNAGSYAYFWTATEYGTTEAWSHFLGAGNANILWDISDNWDGYSVRCIKN